MFCVPLYISSATFNGDLTGKFRLVGGRGGRILRWDGCGAKHRPPCYCRTGYYTDLVRICWGVKKKSE